jgi:polar amino acid transport system substrate-binding protein
MPRCLIKMCILIGSLASPPALAAVVETEIVASAIPPYVYLDKDVEKGVLVEIVQAMAKKVGHSGKITFLPWQRAQTLTRESRQSRPRLIIPLTRSKDREPHYQWIVKLLEDDAVLVTRKGVRPKITRAADAQPLRVGALLGSPLESELHDLKFVRVQAGVDEGVNAQKLYGGRIDVWFAARMVAPFVYKLKGYDPKELQMGASLRVNELYLAASPSLSATESKAWQTAFRDLQTSGAYEKIVAKYR